MGARLKAGRQMQTSRWAALLSLPPVQCPLTSPQVLLSLLQQVLQQLRLGPALLQRLERVLLPLGAGAAQALLPVGQLCMVPGAGVH